MARPFWLRLFGPNQPTTLVEFREALANAPFGQALGDGHSIATIRAILNLPLTQRSVSPDLPLRPVIDTLHDAQWAVPGPVGATDSGVPASQDIAVYLPGEDQGRTAALHLNSIVSRPLLAGGPSSAYMRLDTSVPYLLIGDMDTGLVIDASTRKLMPGGPGDYPELLAGAHDTLELGGDYSAGFELEVRNGVEQVILHAGNDYNLIAGDEDVAAGARLTVNAMPLADANRVLFDGTAETDGSFLFYGSDTGDMFLGGAGKDIVYGLGGGDVLSGGGGSDSFVYYDAAHSSGADHDLLADFDAATDKIDLNVTVSGFDAAIAAGTLSADSFDADLGAALAGLGAGRAVYYAPDAGDLAGTVFLVVDANGIAGYQEGEDYVFAMGGATLADLSGHTGFLI